MRLVAGVLSFIVSEKCFFLLLLDCNLFEMTMPTAFGPVDRNLKRTIVSKPFLNQKILLQHVAMLISVTIRLACIYGAAQTNQVGYTGIINP